MQASSCWLVNHFMKRRQIPLLVHVITEHGKNHSDYDKQTKSYVSDFLYTGKRFEENKAKHRLQSDSLYYHSI